MDAQRPYAILLTVLAACTPGSPGVNDGAQVKGDETATTSPLPDTCPPTPQPVCACDSATAKFRAIADQLATPTEEGAYDGAFGYTWVIFELRGLSVEEALCQSVDGDAVMSMNGGLLMSDTVATLELAEFDGHGFFLVAQDNKGAVLGRAAAEIGRDVTDTEIAVVPESVETTDGAG